MNADYIAAALMITAAIVWPITGCLRDLRERAEAERVAGEDQAPRGEVVSQSVGDNVAVSSVVRDASLYANRPDAVHIASWHPAVALAVADWLIKSAETYERLEDDLRGLEGVPTIEQVYGYDFTEAIAVARAYVGADA